mgnify:FL=1
MGLIDDIFDFFFGGGLEDEIRRFGKKLDEEFINPIYDFQKGFVNAIIDDPITALSTIFMPTNVAWIIPVITEANRYVEIKNIEDELGVDLDYDWTDSFQSIFESVATQKITGKISEYLDQVDFTPEFLGDSTLFEGLFEDGLSSAGGALIVGDSAYEGFKRGLAGQTTAELASITMGYLDDKLSAFNFTTTDGELKTIPKVVQNTLSATMNAELEGQDISSGEVFAREVTKLAVTQEAVRGVLKTVADQEIRYLINDKDTGLTVFDKLTDNSEQSNKALSFLTSSINNVVATALAGGTGESAANQLLQNINKFGVEEMTTLLTNSIVGDTLDSALDVMTGDFTALKNGMETLATYINDNKTVIDTTNTQLKEIETLTNDATNKRNLAELNVETANDMLGDGVNARYYNGKFFHLWPDKDYSRGPQIFQIIETPIADFVSMNQAVVDTDYGGDINAFLDFATSSERNNLTSDNYFYGNYNSGSGYGNDNSIKVHDGNVYTLRPAYDMNVDYNNFGLTTAQVHPTSFDSLYPMDRANINKDQDFGFSTSYVIPWITAGRTFYAGPNTSTQVMQPSGDYAYQGSTENPNSKYYDPYGFQIYHTPSSRQNTDFYTSLDGQTLSDYYNGIGGIGLAEDAFSAYENGWTRYHSTYGAQGAFGIKASERVYASLGNIIDSIQFSIENIQNYTTETISDYETFAEYSNTRLQELANTMDYSWQDQYNSLVDDLNLAIDAMTSSGDVIYNTFADDFTSINETVAKAMDPLFNAQDYFDMYGDFGNNFTQETAAQHYVTLGSKRNAFTNTATRDAAMGAGKFEFIDGATYYSADGPNVITPPMVEGATTLFGDGVTVADVVSANAIKTYDATQNAYVWEKKTTSNLSMWDPQNGTRVVSDGYTIIDERELDFDGYQNTLDQLEALDANAINEIVVYATKRDSDTASLPFTSYIPSIDWQMRAEAEAQAEKDRLAHEAKLREIENSDATETEKEALTAREIQAYELLGEAGDITSFDMMVLKTLMTMSNIPSQVFGDNNFGRDLDYAAANAQANIIRAYNGIKTSLKNTRARNEAYRRAYEAGELFDAEGNLIEPDYEVYGLDPKYGAFSLLLEEFADARSSEDLQTSMKNFSRFLAEYENDPERSDFGNAVSKYAGAIKNAPRAFLFDSIATEVFETAPSMVVGGVVLKAGQGFRALAAANMNKAPVLAAYSTEVVQAMGNTYESAFQRIYAESENQLKNVTELKYNIVTGEFYEAPKYTTEEIDSISKKHADAGAQRAEITQLVTSLALYKLGAAEAEKAIFGEVVNNKTFRETFEEIARVTAGEGVAELGEESAVQLVESLYVFNNINSSIEVSQEVADSGVYGLFTGAGTAGSMTTAKGLGQHAYNYVSNSEINSDLNGFNKFFSNDPTTNMLMLNSYVGEEIITIKNDLNAGKISTDQADQAANKLFYDIGLTEDSFIKYNTRSEFNEELGAYVYSRYPVGPVDALYVTAIRTNLLNAINDADYNSTDEVNTYFQSFGYTATAPEIYQFATAVDADKPLYNQIAEYVEPLILTVDDVVEHSKTLGATISNEEAILFAGAFSEEDKNTALSNRSDVIRSVPKYTNAAEFKNYLVTEKDWSQEQADTYYDANKTALDNGIQTLSKSYIEQEFGSTFDKAVLTEEEVARSIREAYPNLANETTENLRINYPGFFDQVTLPTDEIDTNNLKVEGKDIVETMSLPEAETITESEVRSALAESLGVAVEDLDPVYDSFINSAVARGRDVILSKNQSTQEIANDITTIQNRFSQSDYTYTDQDVANLLGQAGVVGDGDVDSYLDSRQYTYEDARTDFMNALRISNIADPVSESERRTLKGGRHTTRVIIDPITGDPVYPEDPFADTAVIDRRQGVDYLLPDDIAFIESLVGLNTTDVVGRQSLLDSIDGYLQEQYTKAENALKAAGVINPVESDVLQYIRTPYLDTGITLTGEQISGMSQRGVDALVDAEVTEQIGSPAREVTQEDIDRVTEIVTPDSDTYISPVSEMGYTPDFGTDIIYDVNNDGVVDSSDLTILRQIQDPTVYGQPTDLSTDSVFADTGVYANIDTDTQTDTITDAITDINTRINTEIAEREKAEKEAKERALMQQLTAERPVRVTTPDAAEIDYVYDFESIFATPEQQQQYEGALPYKVAAAKGGLINDQTDELLAMLEALDK